MASERVSSVGRDLGRNQVSTFNHPAYRMFSEAVAEELTQISERETERRASAHPLLVNMALSSEEMNMLASEYPEFAVVVTPLSKSVHSYWRALRLAANEWLQRITARYSQDVVHFGGLLVPALMRKHKAVHLEADPTSVVMTHERVDDIVNASRMFSDYVTVSRDAGVQLPREQYDAYVSREAYEVCDNPSTCTHQAEAMCVDLSVVEMSPVQVALAMLQHGAKLCHGFYIYDPAMLVQDEGELGVTGVTFKRTQDSILFRYPEGNAGAESYSRDVWSRWVASHVFSVGSGNDWFQLELLNTRGAMMFFRMVYIGSKPRSMQVKHALDLSNVDDYMLVSSFRLKHGLSSDPLRSDSWETYHFLARERVVKRVYEFAMQLSPANFSRYAIKKQIRVVNNRWVVAGSTVSVTPALAPQQVEDLTTAIYSRAFVDRYESSQLALEMKTALDKVVAFNSLTYSDRVFVVAKTVFSSMYRSVLGKAVDTVKGFCDGVTDFCSVTNRRAAGGIVMQIAPKYMTFKSAVGTWRQMFDAHSESYYCDAGGASCVRSRSSAIGGALADYMRQYSREANRFRSRSSGEEKTADLVNVARLSTDVVDTRLYSERTEAGNEFARLVEADQEVAVADHKRYNLEFEVALRDAGELVQQFKHAEDPDPVSSLNSLYRECFPAVAGQKLQYDTFSLSLDPQDRVLSAPYLRMPTYFGLPPNPRNYYPSNLVALNVPKRQNTSTELLTAIAARNLAAPAISVPQEQDLVIKDIWDNFLSVACVEDAPMKLKEYQSDPVALAEDGLRDWAAKAKPEVLERVKKELREQSVAMDKVKTGEYLAMLKADVKPTLSNKPVNEITAPQVIVYHDKTLSALYSSVFRVLVRRFLSLLKPNYHVNLLKDVRDISEFLTQCHPYGKEDLKFLENDFSKYDKSQSEFAFELEKYVFVQLGLNAEMLERWLDGHVESTIRSVATGLSLHVMYQRKSGDATTAFGNVILNVLSVCYAYKGTQVVWAVFMGDDSLVCATAVASTGDAVQILAEVFNLTAKYYLTESPYYASNFVVIDNNRMQVQLVPDPIKRIERMSMHVVADDPQWKERFVSYQDSLQGYLRPETAVALARLVPLRYEVSEGLVRGAAAALGTIARDEDKFRKLWADEPEIVQG